VYDRHKALEQKQIPWPPVLPAARPLLHFEGISIAAISLLIVALRTVAYVRYRFDSDEPQHLHVAWGWSAGLVQYRDFFDNHAPLFHILMAPLLRLVGERADVLLYMRASMLPLFALALAGTYLIARQLYSRQISLWSVLLLASYPPFFLKTLEFRTDNLWNTLWIVTLALLTTGPLTMPRLFLAGFILGCALGVSLKTTLLFATLALAAVICMTLQRGRIGNERITMASVLRAFFSVAAGASIVPIALIVFLHRAGAWRQAVYCTITFNERVAQTRHHVWLLRSLYPLFMAVVIGAAWRWMRDCELTPELRRRCFLAVAAGVFVSTLCSFWIMISTRDLMPLMPIAAIFTAAGLQRLSVWRDWKTPALLSATAIVLCALTVVDGHLYQNQTRTSVAVMRQVLGLTRPGEPLMDYKGETIYRPRPVYFILEAITRAQLQQGIIRDTIPEDVIASHCFVAQADGEFYPPRGGAFLRANFIDMGRLRAAGKLLTADQFNVALPGPYVIVDASGFAHGLLDGTRYTTARQLTAGVHTFTRDAIRTAAPAFAFGLPAPAASRATPLALLWAPAYARGYSPFHLRDREL
jgi:hypothetical protein